MASANVELVRSIYAAWERGDFSSTAWADPEIEYVVADGPEPGSWTGIAAMTVVWRAFAAVLKDIRTEPDEYRELDDGRVLVFVRRRARAKTSGVEFEQIKARGAGLFEIHGGKVTRIVHYWDRERALADLGLAPEARSRDS